MLTLDEVKKLRNDAIAEYDNLRQQRDNEPSDFVRELLNAQCTKKSGYISALSDVLGGAQCQE